MSLQGQLKKIPLETVEIEMSVPRVVAETSEGRCWFPDILKFSTGEIMLNHSMNRDSNENQFNAQAVYISGDNGKTFDFAYDVNGFHNAGGEPRIAQPDGRIVGTTTYLFPDPPGQGHDFAGHYWTFDKGGKRYCVEPWAVKVRGIPRPVQKWNLFSRTWKSRINWFSDIVVLKDGGWLSTISLTYEGDELSSTVAVVSSDEGYNWRYLSTIANADSVPGATEGFDEPCLLTLDSGEIMCVSRVGGGSIDDRKLARTYSADNGRTWSEIDRLPAYSVAPQILKLTNGVIVLSTGRPGVFLWFSVDSRGQKWEVFDLTEFHNTVLGKEFHIDGDSHQTTAYTAMIEVSQDRVLLVYDRMPFSWEEVKKDSGEKSYIMLSEFSVRKKG